MIGFKQLAILTYLNPRLIGLHSCSNLAMKFNVSIAHSYSLVLWILPVEWYQISSDTIFVSIP